SPPPSKGNWPRSTRSTSRPGRTVPGRTAKPSVSTAPCRSTGPTAPPTSPTSTAPKRSRPGSSTTTTLDHTPPAAADPRSAGCHQPHDRVQLARAGRWAESSVEERVEPERQPAAVDDAAHGEQHAGHEGAAVEGVGADRQQLAGVAEQDLLVRHQPAEPDRVHGDAVDAGAARAG